jgi:hypothetical protein
MTGAPKTVVKRTKDAALEHVKKALRTNGNLLTRLELGFIRTSCQILGINSEATIRVIVKRAKEKGDHQPRKVLNSLQTQLEELAARVEKHMKPTPTPAFNTWTLDSMGAPARSLGHLQSCVDGLSDAMEGGYSMGIKTARIATENAKADFKATIDRIAEASRWKRGVTEDWLSRGEMICAGLMEEAEEVFKKAEAREEAEARLRIMESQCEELAEPAEQAGKQVPAEAEAELLIDLEEEIGQRKETVGDLGRVLKETAPAELKDRVEQAIQDSVMMAKKGRRYVDHMKTRLEFISKDSESGSYKGATGEGVVPGQWRTAVEELEEEDGSEEEMEEPYGANSGSLLDVMCAWGHMKANDSGWPTFDGRYASYRRFKKEWRAYRETYHSAVNNDLAAKALRDKCIQGDALRMVSHLDDLREIWKTLNTCYERPEKYMEEVLRPIVEFRRYKVIDSAAVREFYSLLRAAIKGAKGIERLSLLINDQTVPKIMSKMPHTDWKEWATKRPEWMQEDLAPAFEKFLERKWQDALNIAAAEPSSWGWRRRRPALARGPRTRRHMPVGGSPRCQGRWMWSSRRPSPDRTLHHGTFRLEGSVGRGTW